jgi:hypothetical protein
VNGTTNLTLTATKGPSGVPMAPKLEHIYVSIQRIAVLRYFASKLSGAT